MKSSRHVNKVLSEASSELAMLVTRTKQISNLTAILRQQLDTNLAPHCYVGSIEQNKLTVIVDSAAWATKFRFYSPVLLPNLKQAHHSFAKIEQIQLKILQPVQKPESDHSEPGNMPQINQENARGISTLAEAVDDPDLQAALLRLAKHAK